jgi:hypothetical protein
MNKSLSDLKVALDYATKRVDEAISITERETWEQKVKEINMMMDESVRLLEG